MPQLSRSVRFGDGEPLESPLVRRAIHDGEVRLGAEGRLVIRKSGTEPVIRVMAESEDEDLIDSVVKEICQALHTFAAGNGVERPGTRGLDPLSAQAAE